MSDVRLIQGDCLERMAEMPDGSVDAVVTDPPYCSGGVSESSRTAAKGQGLRSENLSRFGWFVGDNMTTAGIIWLLRNIALESLRVLGGSGSLLMFCDWRMLHNLAPAVESAGLRYQGLVVWDKGSIGMGNGFRCQHELVMHFTCGAPKYYNRSTGNVLSSKRIGAKEREHQTQKPVELMERLINVVVPEGGMVLDPFMGSASTGVAAINTGRKFIGIERDEAYFAIAQQRIDAAIAERNAQLFVGVA